MRTEQHRARKRAAPAGVWLGFLALALHVLAPFFLAIDLASAATRADPADTVVICTAYGTKSALLSHQERSHHRHGLLNGCPVCTAIAAGQAIPLSESPALPLPQNEALLSFRSSATSHPVSFGAAFYHSRAPPSVA